MRLTRPCPAVAAILALVLSANACGNPTGNTITLTQAEVSEVFAEMSAALSSGGGINLSRTTQAGPVLQPAPIVSSAAAGDINATVSCTGGGSVNVAGTVNGAGTSSASFDLTESFNSCKTTHFTVGGSLRYTGSISTSPTSLTFQETTKGDLSVSHTDGRSGNCHIDFSVNGSFNSGTGTGTVTASGTICGVEANAIVTS